MPLESNPYLPSSLPPLVAEMWQGVRTDTNRVGVPENYDYWLDGFFPYAPRRLRVMPDIGSSIFTRADSLTIVFYKFVNLGATPLCMVVMSDGSVIQVNMNTLAQTTVLPTNTIFTPSQLTTDINQWGAQYILIVSTQPNGYWVWDGTILYAAGTLGPVVVLTSPGSGYVSLPLVTASGGSGSGATFQAQIANGEVTSVVVTNPGSGYVAGDTPSLVFTGGLASGTGATLIAIMSHQAGGSAASVNIIHGAPVDGAYQATCVVAAAGSGYDSFTQIQIVNGAAIPVELFSVTPSIVGGELVGLLGRTTAIYEANGSFPTASVVDRGYYYISSATVKNQGSGYSNYPKLSVTVSSSANTISAQPVLTAIVNNGTFPTPGSPGASIISGGVFSTTTAPTIVITDVAAAASAVLALSGTVGQVFPFGIQGNAVETYSGQVWVANGNNRYTSAPGSVTDFATSDGGLSVQDNDSFLKVGYTRLIQMNGFLWMVADCSVNYIGNVTTTGSPPTTNYSKQNADPEVGTIWPNTVIPWGNQLLFANSWGVFLGLGSRMQKVSDELDGVYQTVLNPAITPSVAKMTLFGRKIVFLLLPIIDPVSGVQQNKLLCWDGKKWWASSQSKTLTYIATQEINSVLTAYGTDGVDIYPLFTTASGGFTKTLQTRLWDAPGSYLVTKAAGRLFGVARYNSTVTPNLIIRLDDEAIDTGSAMGGVSTYTITGPTVTGNFVIPPQAIGQTGVFTGLTLQTTAADVEIVSLAIAEEIVGYRG